MTQAAPDPQEVQVLLNPALGACILASFAEAYVASHERGPFLHQFFLVLPITLHHRSRHEVLARQERFGLHRFSMNAIYTTLNLPQRVGGLAERTRLALLLATTSGVLAFDKDGCTLRPGPAWGTKVRATKESLGREGWEAARAARRLGAWFSKLTTSEVFLHLGVKV